MDEAGFYLLLVIVRSYAPIDETPVLRAPLTWDHLSVINAVTPAGGLYLMMQEQAFKGPAIVCFLKHLLHHLPARSWSFEMVCWLIMARRCGSSWSGVPLIASIWNACRGTPPTSVPTKAFGAIAEGLNSATFVAATDLSALGASQSSGSPAPQNQCHSSLLLSCTRRPVQ
jgi:hypothetical protein